MTSRRHRLLPGLLAAVLGCWIAACDCQISASSSASPLHVALVRFGELPQHSRSSPRPALTAAAALRAAGYPTSPQLSRPPLQRTQDVLQANATQGRGVAAHSLSQHAVPIPLGGGTSPAHLYQQLHSPSAQRRTLLQQQQHQHQHQQQQQQQAPPGGFQLRGGFAGIASPVPAGTTALAASPTQLLQAAGGVVTLHAISAAGEVARNSSRSVLLSHLMQAAPSAGCAGVFDPAAAYDAAAGRFVLSATCGGQGIVLLAASATNDAAGAWFVFSLVADGVGSALACASSSAAGGGGPEAAIADYSQVGYNSDGVFVTYKSVCPSSSSGAGGVGLLALPKWALYRGMPTFHFPLYTGRDIAAAAAAGAAAAAAGAAAAAAAAAGSKPAPAAAGGCTQLVPVLPQGPRDVGVDEALFVCEAVDAASEPQHAAQRRLLVAALVDTATLWQYGGPASNASTPIVAAQAVELQAAAPPVTGLPLRQPLGAAALQQGIRPRGFWYGAAVSAGGKLYLATSTLAAADKASSSTTSSSTTSSSTGYSRRPALVWAELAVKATTSGSDTCTQSRAGAASRQSWDASRDYSKEWDRMHAAAATALEAVPPPFAAAGGSGSSMSNASSRPGDRVIHAAFKPLALGAYATVGLFQLGAQPCTCYACYWGGSYYRYSGYGGGALAGTGSGFASGGYFPVQGQMSRCQSTCTKCWYYGYPGHGFGNVGEDRTFLDIAAAAPFAANASGATRADGPSINAAYEAALTSLFAACDRRASLAVSVARQGVVTQGGRHALGLAFPALAVSHSGDVLLTFTYAGPGNASDSVPAFAGVGAVQIPHQATEAALRLVRAGKGTVKPAALAGGAGAALSGGWAELAAVALHAPSGTVFSANPYAAAAAADAAWVGTWVSAWRGAAA